MPDFNTKETSNQQPRTCNQQKAPQHTPQASKKNCNTCQHKVAPLTSNNLHDTAHNLQDTVLAGAPTQSARIAKQYHFDASPAKQYLATILQFLDLTRVDPASNNKDSVTQMQVVDVGTIGTHPGKNEQCLQSGVNVGPNPYYNASGIRHGTS